MIYSDYMDATGCIYYAPGNLSSVIQENKILFTTPKMLLFREDRFCFSLLQFLIHFHQIKLLV